MYGELVQTAILLMLLWIALMMWLTVSAALKVMRLIRMPFRPVKFTRRDFNVPFIQYIAVSVVLRYLFKNGK